MTKFLFNAQRTSDFYEKQIEKDNRAVEKIQNAKSDKEIRRLEKQWRREEKRDRERFDREMRNS